MHVSKKEVVIIIFFASFHAAPPAARRLCQLKRIKRSPFRLTPAGSVGVVCAALMWRREAGRLGERRRGAPSASSAPGPPRPAGPNFRLLPPTRCRRIPPECRGNPNGSTVPISVVDHMMGDIKERGGKNTSNHSSFS